MKRFRTNVNRKKNGNSMFFPTSYSYTTIILLVSLLQYSCRSFSPPLRQQQLHNTIIISSSSGESTSSIRQQRLCPLSAITKRQTCILDGAELSYYIQSLTAEQHLSSNSSDDVKANTIDNDSGATQVPDVAPRSLQKRRRVASISFATAVLDEQIVLQSGEVIEKGVKVVGVEVVQEQEEKEQEPQQIDSGRGRIITIDTNVQLYQDSIAVIPPSLKASDEDVISTAAASLLGIHSSSTTKQRKRAVVVGGGDHAIFLAKALVALNVKTYLVTARPEWSLPSPQDIVGDSVSSKDDLIEIMSPAVGSMSLGFAMAIGEFDVLIDTLEDVMGMGRARTIVNNNDGYNMGQSSSSLQQWKELHGCSTYLSTITRSQQYVLGKGLLFARDAVIRYQQEVESKPIATTSSLSSSSEGGGGVIPSVPPPRNFGMTIQSLLEKHVVYPVGSNEVGAQGSKSTFVRGWSLSDLTELKTWPRASDGAGRFGFPVIDLNAPRRIRPVMKESKKGIAPDLENTVTEEVANDNDDAAKQETSSTSELTTSMMEKTVNTNSTRQIKVTKSSAKKKLSSSNPYVTSVSSASELNQNIVEARRNCILYLSASYCQKCKRLTPQFQRLARKSSESSTNSSSASDVLFAHVDISAGAKGKQLGKLLNVEKVPSVILFKDGKQVELDEGESSVVVEKANLNRLVEVADALDKGESHLKLKELLSVPETIQK